MVVGIDFGCQKTKSFSPGIKVDVKVYISLDTGYVLIDKEINKYWPIHKQIFIKRRNWFFWSTKNKMNNNNNNRFPKGCSAVMLLPYWMPYIYDTRDLRNVETRTKRLLVMKGTKRYSDDRQLFNFKLN